ncbi:unnamed protein product, partial [Iphiclides podalirius]
MLVRSVLSVVAAGGPAAHCERGPIRRTRLRESSFTCIILMEPLWPDVLCRVQTRIRRSGLWEMCRCISAPPLPQSAARLGIKWRKGPVTIWRV